VPKSDNPPLTASRTSPLNDNHSFRSIDDVISYSRSAGCDYYEAASRLLCLLVDGDPREFYATHFGRAVRESGRSDAHCFASLFSRGSFEDLLRSRVLHLDRDVTASRPPSDARNNQGETRGGSDVLVEANSAQILADLEGGNCVQLLCPQKYDDQLWRILSLLEIEFESVVGCRAILMPSSGVILYISTGLVVLIVVIL
jgi:hypothetical protein